ncbi:tyrosine-type recombinase/integrase [Nocardia sp. alder85J]|uniref:tyrosine-type recombinase/integrase n=1 Tax=Nocardia sp. alder85J TaxID=2862949 RepID=UPI001CD36B97|nr:site-specific integrase [Nocardia sp. alder85J]MCX4097401.1 site-specific integrase [Nocardia sp. alder85J]
MSRRVRGGGSVYKRKDGRWEGTAYLPTPSGAVRRVSVYGKTGKEANDKLAIKLADAKRGIPVPERAWTVGGYLDYWMANVAPKDLRPSTLYMYEGIIRLHIKPVLASRSLTRLTVVELQKFMNEQVARGMTNSTSIQVKTVLMAALTNAMREDVVQRNVARLVKLKTPERKQVHPWTVEEVKHFLTFIREEQLYPAFLITAIYGTRLGEVMGLRWSDIDWERNILHIRQQLLIVGNEFMTGPLKTKQSKRDLPLLLPVRLALIEYRQTMMNLGIEPADDLDLIFRNEKGLPVRPSRFGQYLFHKLAKAAGLRRVRFHDFRHSAATLLKNLGVPDKDIQGILGHAKVSTTQEIYQHVDISVQQQGLSRVEHVLMNSDASTQGRQLLPSRTRFEDSGTPIQSVDRPDDREMQVAIPYFERLTSDRSLTPVMQQLRAATTKRIFGSFAVNLAVKSSQSNSSSLVLWEWLPLREALTPSPSRKLSIRMRHQAA